MAIGSLRSGSAGRAALRVEQVRALQETFGLSQPLAREGGSSMHITLHCTKFSASGWQS